MLWVLLGYPPVLQFLLNTLLVVVFVVLRYGAAVWYEEKHRMDRSKRTDKRDFLLSLGC